jgi:hypothetical protein
MRSAYRVHSGNLKGEDHLGNLGVDVKIILKWFLKK